MEYEQYALYNIVIVMRKEKRGDTNGNFEG